MQSITEKIKNHIESLSLLEIQKFYKNNFQLDIKDMITKKKDFYKNGLFNLICEGYEDCKKQLILNQEEAYNDLLLYNPIKENYENQLLKDYNHLFSDQEIVEMIKNKYEILEPINEKQLIETVRFQLNNINDQDQIDKNFAFFNFYRSLKYFKTREVVEKFYSLEFINYELTHFVEFDKIEDVFFEIIKSGVFIKLSIFLLIVDCSYNERISREIFKRHVHPKRKKEYDSRDNVPQLEIDIKNMLRRRKYSTERPRPQKFEDLLFERENEKVENLFFQNNFELKFNLFDTLFDVLNFRHSGTLKYLLKEELTPVVNIIGRPKTLLLFKPFFYVLFEDNYDGLLTEVGFDIENDENLDFVGTYRSNYNSYYSTRVKTLAGI